MEIIAANAAIGYGDFAPARIKRKRSLAKKKTEQRAERLASGAVSIAIAVCAAALAASGTSGSFGFGRSESPTQKAPEAVQIQAQAPVSIQAEISAPSAKEKETEEQIASLEPPQELKIAESARAEQADFVRKAKKAAASVSEDYLVLLGEASKKHGNDKWLMLGILVAESAGDPMSVSPPTKYGYSRGLMQVNDATARDWGYEPKDMTRRPDLNIEAGNRIFRGYYKALSGGEKAPKEFQALSASGDFMKYNGKFVVDQTGQKVPLKMLAAMAYNGGNYSVLNAIVRDKGKLTLDPRLEKRSLSVQQLDYALKVSKFCNFGYKFSFEKKDVPKELVLAGK